MLSKDYNLPNPVINVLIDFVLQMNNNVLSKYSVEKIAASLSREKIETAIDAMEYLRENYVKENKKSRRKSPKSEEPVESSLEESTSEEDDSELLEFFKDR